MPAQGSLPACPTCGHAPPSQLSEAGTELHTRVNPSTFVSALLVFVGAVEAVATSGVVFGWAPLQMMLQEEGIYGDLCPNGPPCQVGTLAMPARAAPQRRRDDARRESETARTQLTRWASQEQGVRLQMIYTVATSAFCFCVWPTGVVLDTYGPRACCMMGALFFGIGCALFAYSDATHDFFMPGFVFMGIGGLPVVLSMMHLSELMPWLAGTIMTIFNVMIDVSSLDLQLFRVAVSNGMCSRQEAFTYYMAVPLAIFVTAPLLWPKHKYESAQTGADAVDDVVLESPRGHDGACLHCLPTLLPASHPARERGHACRPPACLRCPPRSPRGRVLVRRVAALTSLPTGLLGPDVDHDKLDASMTRKQWLRAAPFSVQMMSKEFIFCTLFTAMQLLHINLYIGTVDDQLSEIFPPSSRGNTTKIGTSESTMTYMFLATEHAGETSPLTLARSMELQWFGSGRALSVSTVGSGNVAGTLLLAPVTTVAADAWSAEDLCAAFSWMLPLGGLAFTWPVGAVLDNLPLSAAIFMLSLSAVVHGVFALAQGPLASPMMQLVGFTVFSYYRAALFGTMATTIAFAFGHGNFGKLWGLLYAVSGIANFCIAPLALLAKTQGSYLQINTATLVGSGFLMLYSYWLRQQEVPERGPGIPAENGWPTAEVSGARREPRQEGSYHRDAESSCHSQTSRSGHGNDTYASRSSAPRRRSELEGGLLANAH